MASCEALKVAVIGAGMAGATCAKALSDAGMAVHVFDKSRGAGGRLATRRMDWVDGAGQACTTPLDHGAVGLTVRSEAFQGFIDEATSAGSLAPWSPTFAAGGLPWEEALPLHVPLPDLPALCRHLLADTATTWSFPVDALHRHPQGWQLAAAGERHDQVFDAVLLALPPAQAAPLLAPHRADWARRASVFPMQPCWTLMGVAVDDAAPAIGWNLFQPQTGPLALVMRNDARPGRSRVPGQAHWVAHARAAWSRRHLDVPAEWVQPQLQAALAEALDQPVVWHHATVHRWRYAVPQAHAVAPAEACWWDAAHGLGVCGDFLGGSGAEGAWLSARALSTALVSA